MEKPFTDSHRISQVNLLQIFTDWEIKTFNAFEMCDDELMKEPKKRVLGKDSTQVGFSIEKDLVTRIDQLAHRDCISRSSWMREALIHAWRESKEFKRTPLHGYLITPIALTPTTLKKSKRNSLKTNNMGGGGGG
jgi:hypothetical protein